MKRVIFVIILIAIVAASIYYLKFYNRKPVLNQIELSGTMEATDVDVSFQVPGKILKINKQEGDAVKKGELLAVMDEKDLVQQMKIAEANKATIGSQIPQLEIKILASQKQEQRQLEQATAQIDQARFQWISLKKGSRDEQIAQAKYVIAQAEHNLEHSKKEYDRAQNLYKDGALPGQQRDAAETTWLVSKDQLRQAQENYKLLVAGPRKEDVDAAYARVLQAEAAYRVIETQKLETEQLRKQMDIYKAQIEQAEKNIRQAKIQVDHTKVYSPLDGVVLVRPREPGEVVNATTTILTLADIKKLYLKAYVGETDLGKVKLGQKVIITTDSFPGKSYEGTIYYISSQAEFTPKNLTTREDRVKLVYRIKVAAENPNQELKPGMIADGIIKL